MPRTVHVVDDDASFRTAIERRLKKAGYEVTTYPSAQHLLDRLPDDHEPGCILLDVQMPGLSGPELQGYLSRLSSTLPIVFLTGHADTRTTVHAIKAGAEDFLTKPVSSEDLLKAIERALARHEVARDRQEQAGGDARPYRSLYAARTAGFRTHRPGQDQQADRA